MNQSWECSLDDIGEDDILRAKNDGQLYRKCGERRIEPVAVRMFGGVVRTGSSICWPFDRPLLCALVTDCDLRSIRARMFTRCLVACLVLGAIGLWALV